MVQATDFQAQELWFRVTGRDRMETKGDGVGNTQDRVCAVNLMKSAHGWHSRTGTTPTWRSRAPGEGESAPSNPTEAE